MIENSVKCSIKMTVHDSIELFCIWRCKRESKFGRPLTEARVHKVGPTTAEDHSRPSEKNKEIPLELRCSFTHFSSGNVNLNELFPLMLNTLTLSTLPRKSRDLKWAIAS